MAGHISTLCFKFCDVALASYHNQRLGNFTEWSLSKGHLKIKGVVLRSTDQLPSLLSGILLKCGRDQSGARSFRAPQGWPVPRLPLVSAGPHQSSCRRKGQQDICSVWYRRKFSPLKSRKEALVQLRTARALDLQTPTSHLSCAFWWPKLWSQQSQKFKTREKTQEKMWSLR